LHMPAASTRDIRWWTGSFRKSKQSTGKCRSLHLVDSAQSVFSSSPDPFRRTKELPPVGCILSRHFRVANTLQVAEPRACSARVRSRSRLQWLLQTPLGLRPSAITSQPPVHQQVATPAVVLQQLDIHFKLPIVFSPLVGICLGPSPWLVYEGCLLPFCFQPSAAQLWADRSNAGTPTAAPLVIRPARRLSAAPLVYPYPLLNSRLFHVEIHHRAPVCSDVRARHLRRILLAPLLLAR